MALLILMAAITAYAIAITVFHMEQNETLRIIRTRMNLEIRSAGSWRARAFKMARQLDEQRVEFNDELHKLEKENKRLLDTNARMMERMKRLMP